MNDSNNVSLTKTIKRYPRGIPFADISKDIMGKKYTLSLVFIADQLSLRLNKTYKSKNKPASVLAFPLSEHEGEVFINQRKAERDARSHGRTVRTFTCYLFIHALLHLKGMAHGSTMESEERKWCKKYNC